MGAATVVLLALLCQPVSVGERVEAIFAEVEARRVAMERERARVQHEEAREFQGLAREMADAWVEFAEQWNRGAVSIESADRFERAIEKLTKHPLWPGKRRKKA